MTTREHILFRNNTKFPPHAKSAVWSFANHQCSQSPKQKRFPTCSGRLFTWHIQVHKPNMNEKVHIQHSIILVFYEVSSGKQLINTTPNQSRRSSCFEKLLLCVCEASYRWFDMGEFCVISKWNMFSRGHSDWCGIICWSPIPMISVPGILQGEVEQRRRMVSW